MIACIKRKVELSAQYYNYVEMTVESFFVLTCIEITALSLLVYFLITSNNPSFSLVKWAWWSELGEVTLVKWLMNWTWWSELGEENLVKWDWWSDYFRFPLGTATKTDFCINKVYQQSFAKDLPVKVVRFFFPKTDLVLGFCSYNRCFFTDFTP